MEFLVEVLILQSGVAHYHHRDMFSLSVLVTVTIVYIIPTILRPVPSVNNYNWTFLDSFAAVIVSKKLNCPMMKVSAFKSSELRTNEMIQIGGN